MFDDAPVAFIKLLRSCPAILSSALVYLLCTSTILFLNKHFKYTGLCCYIVLCGVISNIQIMYPTKYEFMPLAVLLGTVVFSSTFLATDVSNKCYGAQKSKKIIYLSIICNIFFILNMILMLGHNPLKTIGMNKYIDALSLIFIPQVRFTVASYISFITSQLVEISLLRFLGKSVFGHNASLFISAILVDNFVFTLFAFIIFNDGSFSTQNAIEISLSAIVTRVVCNFFNSVTYHIFLKNNDAL